MLCLLQNYKLKPYNPVCQWVCRGLLFLPVIKYESTEPEDQRIWKDCPIGIGKSVYCKAFCINGFKLSQLKYIWFGFWIDASMEILI